MDDIYAEYKKKLRAELAAIKPDEDEYGGSCKAINYHKRKAVFRKGRGNGRKAVKTATGNKIIVNRRRLRLNVK